MGCYNDLPVQKSSINVESEQVPGGFDFSGKECQEASVSFLRMILTYSQ